MQIENMVSGGGSADKRLKPCIVSIHQCQESGAEYGFSGLLKWMVICLCDVGTLMLLPAGWRWFYLQKTECGSLLQEWFWSMCFCFSQPCPSTLLQQLHKSGWNVVIVYHHFVRMLGWQLKFQQRFVRVCKKAWSLQPETSKTSFFSCMEMRDVLFDFWEFHSEFAVTFQLFKMVLALN